jgi:hypothetical protein
MEIAGGIIGLALAVLGLVLAVFWISFPILVYSRLRAILQASVTANVYLKALTEIGYAEQIAAQPQPHAPVPEAAPRFATCKCTTCSGAIQFNPTDAGKTVPCPHCGIETILYMTA